MFKGFRAFVFRGNVIDLAVAVAVGTAFTALVTTTTRSLIEPIVGWVLTLISPTGQIGGTITLAPGYEINIALFIGGVITFFATLTVLYVIFVVPMNRLRRLAGQLSGQADTENVEDLRPADVRVLEEIRDLLREQMAERRGPTGS